MTHDELLALDRRLTDLQTRVRHVMTDLGDCIQTVRAEIVVSNCCPKCGKWLHAGVRPYAYGTGSYCLCEGRRDGYRVNEAGHLVED